MKYVYVVMNCAYEIQAIYETEKDAKEHIQKDVTLEYREIEVEKKHGVSGVPSLMM